jgi:S-DNA-T family DNA segregation ATPase FtsK/SpoIIIE
MAKRTTTNRKATTTRSRKSTNTRSRSAQSKRTAPPAIPLSISPDRQRELFAIALIGIAVVTIVLYFSGSAGAVGRRWVELTQQLLGWGSLLVPLSLGLLGVAILWQEHFEDIRLTGETVIGTFMILMTLLVMLEFALGGRMDLADKIGQGGGVIGNVLLEGIASLFGRPATFVIFCFLGLAGIVLTFKISPRDLITGMSDGLGRFWVTLWSGSSERRRFMPAGDIIDVEPLTTASRRHDAEAQYIPPPDADEIIPTPIAARPTRASLFNRPEARKPQPATPAPATKPVAPANGTSDSVLEGLLAKPAAPKMAAPTVPVEETVQQPLDGFDTPAVYHAWPLPKIDLLETYAEGTISDDEKRDKSRLIEDTLASFKVEARVDAVNVGPAVMQFELVPAIGVKVSKITSLERDLALALAAQSLRIEAPIPGKNSIGIEIPNSATSIVGMREVIESDQFEHAKYRLKLPLGKDVSGAAVVAGMERMPHLLMAGATGSGKSAGINSIICALLLKHSPDELKFIMVDPKMVELVVYNHIPHLLSPVVTELERVVPTLKWATREMERRYKIFAKHGFRNIDSYKQAARKRADLEPMPYIVIIIDELADLMMMAPDEVETLICRLAQMARATGIHLVIATQRPSVDVITGLIKANFPSRIAFAVTSQIDSRVILDMNGAEHLLGRGDMLYLAADAAKPIRVQGTWVSDSEVERIVSFWRNAKPPEQTDDGSQQSAVGSQQPAAGSLSATSSEQQTADESSIKRQAPVMMQGPGEFLSVEDQDELLPEAIKLVQQHSRASASLLQRRLRIGYSKAAQLIDLLEQQGVVGPAEDGRSREVLSKGGDGL